MEGRDIMGIKEAKAKLNKKVKHRGEFDAVYGAATTSKGHLSAVIAALKNSLEAYQDRISGKPGKPEPLVVWIEPTQIKNPLYLDREIDLKDAGVILHYSNDTSREIKYPQFEQYNVSSNLKDKQIVTKDMHGLDRSNGFTVEYKHPDTKTHVTFNVNFERFMVKRFATLAKVLYVDGTEDEIKMDESEYLYKFTPKAKINKITIFENDEELAVGKINAYGEYQFDMKDPGEGKYWRYDTYLIRLIETKNN